MTAKLHVGNLPYSATEEELRHLFGEVGTVVSVNLPTDRVTGRPRGFGFVEMENSAQAEQAISKFNGYSLDGRTIRVEMAREREERPGGYGRPSGQRPEHGHSGGSGYGREQEGEERDIAG